MAEITAAAVMALREKTGLPMMECKKALQECGGNTDQAVEWLRKQGVKTQSMRADRETSCGRLAVYTDAAKGVGTIIEFKCESPPVAGSPDFKDLANDIAKTLALGPGAKSPEELMAQKSLAHPDKTLGELKDDLFNRMREVFELSRIKRIDAACGGYAHHDGSKAALIEITGNVSGPQAAEVAKDREASRLYANIRPISLAVTVTPLLGLLGTVQGMIMAFYTTANLEAGANRAAELASGIYVALITTFAGLCVAIPAAIIAHYLEGRILRGFRGVDDLVAEVLPHMERFENKGRLTPAQLAAQPPEVPKR